MQTVIKLEKAAAQLKFISAEALTSEEIATYREIVAKEEDEFQTLFSEKLAAVSQENIISDNDAF